MLRKGFEEVLANNPNVNRTISFDPELKSRSGKKNILEGIKFIFNIRKEKFDTVISLHSGDRITLLAYLSGAKTRIAPQKQSLRFLINKKVSVFEDSISYLKYYNTIFEHAGLETIDGETEFYFGDEFKNWADKFLSEKFSVREKIISIHPGASEPTKMWKRDNFVSLIKELQSGGYNVLLIGGPQDDDICKTIILGIGVDKIIYYRSSSISQTAALLKKSKLFITHDTGTRHLSVALNVKTLSLVPEDNLDYWDFYKDKEHYYTLIGKRFISEKESYLDGIEVNNVLEKINSLMNNE